MREIKFRAWDEDGYMIYPPFSLMFNENKNIVLLEPDGTFGEVGSAIIALMQFTGLLDKNGKEIYEGDVVRVPEINRKNTAVEFYKGGFVTRGNGMDCEHISVFRNYEVIGNIYENPELVQK